MSAEYLADNPLYRIMRQHAMGWKPHGTCENDLDIVVALIPRLLKQNGPAGLLGSAGEMDLWRLS